MKEIADILREVFVERLKNRFFGTFVFSFVVYNWQVILTLIFADAEISQRLTDAQTSSTVWSVVAPIGIAALYLAVSPWISCGVDLLQGAALEFRKTRKSVVQKADLTRELENEDLRLELQTKRIEVATHQAIEKEVSNRIDQAITDRLKKSISEHVESIVSTISSADKKVDEYASKVDDLDGNLDRLMERFKDLSDRLSPDGESPDALKPGASPKKDPTIQKALRAYEGFLNDILLSDAEHVSPLGPDGVTKPNKDIFEPPVDEVMEIFLTEHPEYRNYAHDLLAAKKDRTIRVDKKRWHDRFTSGTGAGDE